MKNTEGITRTELLAYLPFGLKAVLSKIGKFNLDDEYPNENQNKLCTITEFSTYSENFSGSMVVDNSLGYRFDFDTLDEIDIVLYPFLFINKEIEHKEEKFVPIEKMKELGLGSLPRSLDYKWMYYHQVEKLLEWNIDIFGLIARGLAIDKTTLTT